MKQKFLSILLIAILISAAIGAILERSVFGLDEETSKRYATNDIIFYNPNGGCAEKYPLKPGGLSKAEAEEFMRIYKNSEGCAAELGITKLCLSPFANCTAVSKYFINRHTTKRVDHTGNGKDVVKTLGSLGFPTGSTPQPYAIFSTNKGRSMCGDELCGHTGVVLGISGNTVYTGEAACGQPLSYAKVKALPMSYYTTGEYTFAYTANFIDYSGN